MRVAAIGVSHWHSLWDAAYLRHLSEMADVEIVGIHDDDPEIAAQRVREIGAQTPTYTDYSDMLDSAEPEFVLALGRHDTMAATAHYLLDRGIPFVMEKPMSFNTAELRDVVSQTKATRGFAAVPLAQRSQPLVTYAKQLIEEGTYGPVTSFYFRMNRPTSARYPEWGSAWMLDPAVASGGCLRNLGAHGFDAFVFLTDEGKDIEVTGAHLSWSAHGQPVEDYATVMVRSPKGVLGTIEVGNAYPRDGTDNAIRVGLRDALLTSEDGQVKLETAEGVEVVKDLGPFPGPGGALRRTLEAAAVGDRPPISVHDCYRAVRLIDLAYLAAGNPYGTAAV